MTKDYRPVLEKIKRTLAKVDPESHQITSGDSWSPMVFRGERYWLRYDFSKFDFIVDFSKLDFIVVDKGGKDRLMKAKQDGIAGLIIASDRPRTRVWLVPIDKAIQHASWIGQGKVIIHYKKIGRSV